MLSDHAAVLEVMDSVACEEPFHYLGFAYIISETGFHRKKVRRIARHLARKGLTEFSSGLWSEDGQPKGSGYCITRAGREAIEENRRGHPQPE